MIMKKQQKNVALLNDRGFTLLEMLLSLFTFLLIASALLVGIRIILNDGVFESGIHKMEWEIFSSQVKKEIRSADQLTVYPEKILMKIDGKVILYEKYGTNIRRRVDFQGHEILMQNLSGFQFERIPEGVGINAFDISGKRNYSVRVQTFIQAGEVTP